MYHTIEFAADHVIDLEVSRRSRLERVLVRKGTRLQAMIKPGIMEGEEAPIEVADLFFENGTASRCVPFDWFSLVD
jgi:hypothetical protein